MWRFCIMLLLIIINYAQSHLLALKKVFRSKPYNQTAYPGESVVMRCSPPRGYPVPTVSWLHNGLPVTNTSRTFISPKGNLTISSVTEADQGTYVCKSSSPLGTQNSNKAWLTIGM